MSNIDRDYLLNLDLNLLRVFAVVAEESSITKAASRLYVTQPSVSAAMQRLATYVGAELVARQGRGIVLTRRGVALLAAVRTYLRPLLAAAVAAPLFDAKTSSATVRLGLADSLEALLLPSVLRLVRRDSPHMQLIVVPVQFRSVEELLLSEKVDIAVSVADRLPKSIRRQALLSKRGADGFVCMYDPRHTRIKRPLTQKEYFAHEHVAVSYAGDARGLIEDETGKSRNVRVAVSSLSHVGDVVDGSQLLATIPAVLGRHLMKLRPHLRCTPLPFSFGSFSLDMLWLRSRDDSAPANHVRQLVVHAAHDLDAARGAA